MGYRDLSPVEQDNVLAYLRYLRGKLGSWRRVELAVPLAHSFRVELSSGRQQITVGVAFRIAKVLEASLYDVLNGSVKLVVGTCQHCGQPLEANIAAAMHGVGNPRR